MKPLLLVLIPMSDDARASMARDHEVLYAPTAVERADAFDRRGGQVRLVLTNGTVGLTPDEIDACPGLRLVSVLGAGYENVAVAQARSRGVPVATGAGTNDDCVADHAMALLLATVRAVPRLDRACRAGVWRDALPAQPNVSHKRLGILGLGTIGRKIARRAEGFEMAIGYHTRTPPVGLDYLRFDDLRSLAAWCDFLVVATPGGAATRHLVDAPVLEALGPHGYLVNIARGSVVDTAALAAALRGGRVRGAGLDVYESEPAPPAELFDFENVVLTPHVAGTSPEAQQATLSRFLDNAERLRAGRPLLSAL